jgi:hypothetical protein
MKKKKKDLLDFQKCIQCDQKRKVYMDVREGPMCKKCFIMMEAEAHSAQFDDIEQHWPSTYDEFIDYE